MSNSGRQPNHDTGRRGPKKPAKALQGNTTEVLSEKPTGKIRPREVLWYGIADAALNGETALFDVLPSVGKTCSISKLSDAVPVSLFTNLRDNYDQFEDFCQQEGVVMDRLPVATDLCPVLDDNGPSYRGDPSAQEAKDAYDNGWPIGLIHQEIDTPCERGNNTCPYCERVAEIDPDGLNPLVGNYTQAYNPRYVEGRVAVVDEDPFTDYRERIKNPIEKAQEYIDTLDEFPFNSARRPDPGETQKVREALEILESEGLNPRDHRTSIGNYHAKAPIAAYAIYDADRMENNLLVSHLPGDRTVVFHDLHGATADDGTGSIWLFDPPDFSSAEAVIALDATPCIADWRLLLGGDLNHYRLFDDQQRNQYLREQGYEFVQLHNYVWPISSGEVSLPKCEAYLREVYRKHDERPDLISSKTLIEGGENWRGEYVEGLEDGDLEHLWNDHLHYNALRGKGDLEESELLVVLGSHGRSDLDIQYHAAFHGECAQPATDEDGNRLTGYDLDYQNEVANEHLDSIRRGEVFQAAMRAGRTDDSEVTVYLATGMVPDWLDTKMVSRRNRKGAFDACVNTRSDSDRDVLAVLRDEDGISGREIARRADLPKSTAGDALDRLRDEGLVELRGRGRGAEWHADCVDDVNIAGYVDLKRMADIPYNRPIRASRPFSEPVIPRRDPPADPTDRYPAWMRDVQRGLRDQKAEEVASRAQRGRP